MFDQIPVFLAQEDGPGETTATTIEPGNPDTPDTKDDNNSSLFGGPFMLMLIGMVVLMFILSGSAQRKQKKKHAALMADMSKGSKVITIGGIKGSVIEVRDDEVLVKVDESANTRLRLTKDAIRTVIAETPEE